MRTLVRLSSSSLSVTTPMPFKAEPSRRMAVSFVRMLVEILTVDCLEAGLGNSEAEQTPPRRNHGSGGFGPDILLRQEQPAARARALDLPHSSNSCQMLG